MAPRLLMAKRPQDKPFQLPPCNADPLYPTNLQRCSTSAKGLLGVLNQDFPHPEYGWHLGAIRSDSPNGLRPIMVRFCLTYRHLGNTPVFPTTTIPRHWIGHVLAEDETSSAPESRLSSVSTFEVNSQNIPVATRFTGRYNIALQIMLGENLNNIKTREQN